MSARARVFAGSVCKNASVCAMHVCLKYGVFQSPSLSYNKTVVKQSHKIMKPRFHFVSEHEWSNDSWQQRVSSREQ